MESLDLFAPNSTVVQSLVQFLTSEYDLEELQKAGEQYAGDKHWPEQYVNRETGRVYKPHHDLERTIVYSDTPKHILVRAGEGAGKALALNTPLPTPTGWTTMGDVQVGDYLFDNFGFPCRVIAISPVMTGHKCYEIVFDDGETIVADADHLWFTLDSRVRKSLSRRMTCFVDGSMRNNPHCQPQYHPHLYTSEELFNSVLDHRGFKNHAVPISKPLRLPDADLPIDPYTLGLWLGDGTSRTSGLTIGIQDQGEMITILAKEGHTLTPYVADTQFGIDTGYGLTRDSNTGQFVGDLRGFQVKLRSLGLLGNKHIPPIYLRASYEQRLALMQGLMDADGYIDEDGRAEFCNTSLAIANGFYELCISLAIKVTCKKGTIRFRDKDFIRYRFSFSPYIPVFRLSRKSERIREPSRHCLRRYRRYIVEVKEHQSVPVKCVQVDTPLQLYLAGRGMIPTHNSAMGIVKTLDRIKRGCSGLAVSPDFEHFKKLWPEFQRWCPWERVHEHHQYRADVSRIPNQPFLLAFDNDIGTVSTLMCGGIQETNTMAWEGPNVNFAWMDEMRRHQTPKAMKTLLGRVRIVGPSGEPPQLWITTTPTKHWLYEYFGEMICKCANCGTGYEWDLLPNTVPTCPSCSAMTYTTSDPWESFKRQAAVIQLSLKDNEVNLYKGFSTDRALSLTEAEARVLLEGEWEDLDDTEHFLPSITLWDTCQATIPPLRADEPLVLGIDAAKGRTNSYSDCFAIVGVTRHWDKDKRKDNVAARFVYTWQARPGQSITFKQNVHDDPAYHGPEGPEEVIRRLIKDYRVVQLAYDPYQLHDLGTRLARERLVWSNEFSQVSERTEADSDLLQLILSRRIVHDGNQTLREHIENADRKVTDEGNRLRIVKRMDHLKIDAAVALSMAAYRCLHLNIW